MWVAFVSRHILKSNVFNADRTFNRHFDIKLPTSTSKKNRTKRPIAVKIGCPFRQTTRTISQLKTGSDPALTRRTHLETLSETFVSKLVASKSFPLLQGEFRSATLDLIVTDLHDFYDKPSILAPLGSADHNIVQWIPNKVDAITKPKPIQRFIRRYPQSALNAFGRWASTHQWFSDLGPSPAVVRR